MTSLKFFKRLVIVSFLAYVVIVLCSYAATAQDKKQCQGKTKAGAQCKHKTAAVYCKVHDPASPRCGATTESGTACKMIVKVAGSKCHHHKQ